jgi:hypothetical protein
VPKSTPANPTAAPDAGRACDATTATCPLKKAIQGRFTELVAKCGDAAHVQADGTNLAEGAATTFALKRVRDGAAAGSASGPMNGQSLRSLNWKPKRPADWKAGDEFEFDVSGDGQSAKSENKFKFHEYPAAGPETKTFNCTSGSFAWTGKFDIEFAADVITVTVKIKLLNRQGAKPAAASDPMPAVGAAVSDDDKASMKADIEGKLSAKVKLYRKDCGFADACSCAKPVKVVVDFVESGEHHEVNLFQGAGRANSANWTRTKTRDNSWAHETGHLLAWYDEYTGGAVGTTPRWKANEAANVMNVGLTVPAEYGWDFRDWWAGKSGEDWKAKN